MIISNISLKVKNKFKKSNIIILLNIIYIETLTFNVKYFVHFKMPFKMFFL
jgi:hypothetical protein